MNDSRTALRPVAPAARRLAGVLLALAALGSGSAARAADLAAFDDRIEAELAAACKPPSPAIVVPAGDTAGRDDMVDAMRTVRKLDADTTAFGDCVRNRMAGLSADPSLTAPQRASIERIGAGRVNDAVDATQRVASAFNDELRKFKARPADGVGSRYVPAGLKTGLDLEGCVPASLRGAQVSFRVRLTVGTDASVTVEEISPLTVAAPMFELAACMSRKMQFAPATRDGVAVPAEVWIPVRLSAYAGQGDDVSAPVLASTPAQFLAATEECYPAELRAAASEGSVKLKLQVSPGGAVSSPVVAGSSGNPALDAAARCIVRRLRFTPVMVDGQPRDVEVTWTLPVKPPAAWLKAGPDKPAS